MVNVKGGLWVYALYGGFILLEVLSVCVYVSRCLEWLYDIIIYYTYTSTATHKP